MARPSNSLSPRIESHRIVPCRKWCLSKAGHFCVWLAATCLAQLNALLWPLDAILASELLIVSPITGRRKGLCCKEEIKTHRRPPSAAHAFRKSLFSQPNKRKPVGSSANGLSGEQGWNWELVSSMRRSRGGFCSIWQ